MAAPTPEETNGVPAMNVGTDSEMRDNSDGAHVAVPGKRKRESDDEGDASMHDQDDDDDNESLKPPALDEWAEKDQKQLIKSLYDVLTSLDIDPPILKRSLTDPEPDEEPQAKRQKSTEPPTPSNISDKVARDGYEHVEDMAADIVSAVKTALSELESESSRGAEGVLAAMTTKTAFRIREFKHRAMEFLRREKAYPRAPPETAASDAEDDIVDDQSEMVLSLVGYAPQERRLFSSLQHSHDVDLSEVGLPHGVSISHVKPTNAQERVQTLGELFAPPRPLPPLQPPKQPKTQAKGNTLDFYHPELTDKSKYKGNSYFTTKLSAGHYLDYSNATPSSQIKTKQRERAQSLAGKKPSSTELEMSEMESLFRGAFSSFAPCKDDSAAVIPSNIAGRMWWQRAGQRNFQRMIEVEYYDDMDNNGVLDSSIKPVDVDEDAIQKAIDNWDEVAVDPSLEDAMGSSRDDNREKEVEEILEEVSDLIETLASYQRIRNLTLPNSQNRQSGDPVNGDMLANSGPQLSEEEQATYQMLKAQLVLIIKTLPPYAVAKLNGDQLDDLLISTKIQVETDSYKGVMEEDDAGVQSRMRAQQQAAQAAQAAQANARPAAQRPPSASAVPHPQQYTPGNHYGTPNRPPSHPQQYYRPGMTPNYQQPRNLAPPASHQQRPPQPNQYSRPNGNHHQYATQLAKAQTPYGHQNMPQFASQQRPQYGQAQPQGTPNNARYPYQQGQLPSQQGTPTPHNYGQYPNGAGMPPRNMSPHGHQGQGYSPSPNMQQNQRYGNQGMSSQMNRFQSNPGQNRRQSQPAVQSGAHSQTPGLTGYHTVIPEAQQQRILDQAKARVAAQERSAMFGDKIAQPGASGLAGIGLGGSVDVNRLAATRSGMANQQKPQTPGSQRQGMNGSPGTPHAPPHKITPVPIPAIPGSQQQR